MGNWEADWATTGKNWGPGGREKIEPGDTVMIGFALKNETVGLLGILSDVYVPIRRNA